MLTLHYLIQERSSRRECKYSTELKNCVLWKALMDTFYIFMYLIASTTRILLLLARHNFFKSTESCHSYQKQGQECHSITFHKHTRMRTMSCFIHPTELFLSLSSNVQYSTRLSSGNKWMAKWLLLLFLLWNV